MDFKAKFPQAVDPFFYTPIPELTLPGDDATISPEWATGKTQDGIAIKMLQAQPLLPQSALSACLLPVTIDSISWTKFIAQIDTIVKIQLRDQRWNFQKEIKTLNDEKDEIETELSQVKDRHRLELTTANSERATEFDRMTAEIQRLSRLATESNQKATEPGTSKDPDLKSVIATRDRYKRERDEAYYQLDNLQDVIDGKNRALFNKETFINKLKIEKRDLQQRAFNDQHRESTSYNEPQTKTVRLENNQPAITTLVNTMVSKEVALQLQNRSSTSSSTLDALVASLTRARDTSYGTPSTSNQLYDRRDTTSHGSNA